MATPTQSAAKCTLCGEPRIAGAKFCAMCGTTFPAAPRAASKEGAFRRAGQSTDLLYVVGAALIAVTLSHLPFVDVAIYPFKLFGTFVHEWCHAIVTIVTGGNVTKLQINTNLSGETFTSGGWLLPIFSAGYVGTAVVGAVLLLIPTRFAARVLVGVGALSMLMPLAGFIAVGTSFTSLTWLWTVVFGGVSLFVGLRAPARFAGLFKQFIAVELCLTAIDSLRDLAWITQNSGHAQIDTALGKCFYGQSAGTGSGTDALNAQCYFSAPAMVWTVLWFVIAVAVIGFAAYRVIRRSVA
jgi:hypothetical protein